MPIWNFRSLKYPEMVILEVTLNYVNLRLTRFPFESSFVMTIPEKIHAFE